jgi:hypothetical protein
MRRREADTGGSRDSGVSKHFTNCAPDCKMLARVSALDRNLGDP